MTEIIPRIGLRPVKILATCIVAMMAVGAHAGTFSAKVLRGIDRLYVAVDGISVKFERNGLTAGELRKRTEDRLSAYGIEIVSEAVAQAAVLAAVRRYEFKPDDGPERNYGQFELEGHIVCFRIDYYDPSLEWGSEDPADAAVTVRVLTIMLPCDD